MEEFDIETIQRVQQLFILQDEREHFLKIFEESFNIYIVNKTRNLTKFRQLVEDSTCNFKRISDGFTEISQKMRSLGYYRLADNIASLQKAEEYRLQLCTFLQILKQDLMHNTVNNERMNQIYFLRELHKKCLEKINHQMAQLRLETKKFNF